MFHKIEHLAKIHFLSTHLDLRSSFQKPPSRTSRTLVPPTADPIPAPIVMLAPYLLLFLPGERCSKCDLVDFNFRLVHHVLVCRTVGVREDRDAFAGADFADAGWRFCGGECQLQQPLCAIRGGRHGKDRPLTMFPNNFPMILHVVDVPSEFLLRLPLNDITLGVDGD